jgi:hypothetical protein
MLAGHRPGPDNIRMVVKLHRQMRREPRRGQGARAAQSRSKQKVILQYKSLTPLPTDTAWICPALLSPEVEKKHIQMALRSQDAYESSLTIVESYSTTTTPSAKQLKAQFSDQFALMEGGFLISDGDELLDPVSSTLLVPQESVVNFAITELSSISFYKLCVPACITVGEVKQRLLHYKYGDESKPIQFYDIAGSCLQNDLLLLSEIPLYNQQNCKLICTQPLDASTYRNGGSQHTFNDVLGLLNGWSAISLGELPAQLSQNLHRSVETELDNLEVGTADLLEPSTYSRYQLPRLEPPTKGLSDQLESVMARFAALRTPANSECPAHATALLDALATGLDGFSPDLAGMCAGAVQSLLPPVEFLASRGPREHQHAEHRTNILQRRDALNAYRDIKAGKLPQYSGTDNVNAMLEAQQAMETVRPAHLRRFRLAELQCAHGRVARSCEPEK